MSIAVMIALQRTGTHALGSVIGQHPDVAYRDEIFSPSRANVPGGYFHFLADKLKTGPGIILPDKSVQRFNQYLKYVEESATKPINLLDVKYSSTHHFNTEWHPLTRAPTFLELLGAYKIPIIHLKRRNIVRMTVSNLMAESTGLYTTDKAHEVRKVRLQINPDKFLARASFLHAEMKLMSRFLTSYPDIITLEYADLFEGNQISAVAEKKIVDLLGISDFEARAPTIIKQIPEPLEDVIVNFDELAAKLQPTIFAPMLFENDASR